MEELFGNDIHAEEANCGHILVVDDDPVVSGMLAATLTAAGHKVVEVNSGEEALSRLATCSAGDGRFPEVIFLDIEMGSGIDGYETCVRLRAQETTRDLPVIFLSSHDQLEERLCAYDAGGSDFLAKPFNPKEVLHKASLAVRLKQQQKLADDEKRSSFTAAMTALTTLGESAVVLKFCRNALGCRTLKALAEKTIESMASFGLECHVQVRVATETLTLNSHGLASPLECSVMDKMRSMGRVFSFKDRVIINYESVSILIVDMPVKDDGLCGRIRDHAALIAEAADLAVDSVNACIMAIRDADELRALARTARSAVEELRADYRSMQVANRVELETMVNQIEAMYRALGMTEAQERAISDTVGNAVDRVLKVFERSTRIDEAFAEIVADLGAAGEESVRQGGTALPVAELW